MIRAVVSGRPLMATAIAVSLAIHATLLAIRFIPPLPERAPPFDSRLPVILVNSRSDVMPLRAEALAQTNLDGGGHTDAGRARSPLPDLGRMADGSSLDAQRRQVAELEQQQHRMLQLLRRSLAGAAEGGTPSPPEARADKPVHPLPELARRQAELARDIADYNMRPLKRQLTPSTREVPYALYYTALRKKIEQTGALHFPQSGTTKIYGDLIVYIPLRQDGFLYERDGGPRVERSSGNPALDAAALAIVRRASPFGRLPATLPHDGREQVWEIVARFSFTREQQLETQALGGSRE